MKNYYLETQAIISDQLGIDASEVTREKTFYDLGADSLDNAELIMAFEEEYGIYVPDVDAEKIKTVGEIVDYLERGFSGENTKGDAPPDSGTKNL